jgi:hypothetical protein
VGECVRLLLQGVPLLLPQSSVNIISYQLEFDLGILPEDGGDLTEVGILQLGSYCAREFFRVTGAKIPLIPRSKDSERLLFVKK